MDFNKLEESGKKIKMPNDMKMRIKEKCTEHKAPENNSKPHRPLNGRMLAVCVCCLVFFVGMGLIFGGAFNKKIPVEASTSYHSSSETTPTQTQENTVTSQTENSFTHSSTAAVSTEAPSTTQTQTQPQQTQISATDEYIFQAQEPPFTLYMEDLNKLKDAKKAAQTMDTDEFNAYLEENHYDISGCFHSPEEYLAFCESELYVPVVDSQAAEMMSMFYTPWYGDINAAFRFNETDCFRFYIPISGELDFSHKDNKEYRYIETVQSGNVTAEIYKRKLWYQVTDTSRWAWGGFAIELLVDGQELLLQTTEEVTLKELKEYLALVEFVKIKDWI